MNHAYDKPTYPSAILLAHCPDRKGLVAEVSDFIHRHNGNIVHFDQHVDREAGTFFMRAEWDLRDFVIPPDKIGEVFQLTLARKHDMTWDLHFSDEVPRMAVFVSKLPHCLYDILARWQSGEWRVDIPLIVSNHAELEGVAKKYGIAFHHIPVTSETKARAEEKQLALLREHKIDFVVLARYMQILSADFVRHYPSRVINIHHSFLPAFPGAKPYHSAHARGVKIIGTTSHYVTSELDAGPIIEQDVTRITHKDSVEDLVRKGKDLEKLVLSRAIWAHLHRKVLVYGNKTVVF